MVLAQGQLIPLVAVLRAAGTARLRPHGILRTLAATKEVVIVAPGDVLLRLSVCILGHGCSVHLVLAFLRGRAQRTGNQVRVEHFDVGGHVLCCLRVSEILLAPGYTDQN